jgi:asparagine synthetase B (glutamine-hydrolysing)
MCGIVGFVGFGSRQDLEAMTVALSHRRPDCSGLWVSPDVPVFLGHDRLSIVDLEGGAQPMWDAAGEIGTSNFAGRSKPQGTVSKHRTPIPRFLPGLAFQ